MDELSPSPIIDTQVVCKSRKPLYVVLIVAVIIAAGITYMWYSKYGRFAVVSALPSGIPGALIFSTPNWDNGDIPLSGVINYPFANAATAAAIALPDPGSPVRSVSLSPDSNSIAETKISSGKSSLVVRSLASSSQDTLLDSSATKIFISKPVWSTDGSQIAYATLSNANVYFSTKSATSTSSSSSAKNSAGSATPTSKLQAYRIASDGKGTIKNIGSGIPIGFSPDGTSIALVSEGRLSIVGATSTPEVAGVPFGLTSTAVFSKDSKYLAVTNLNSVIVYRLDWQHGVVAEYGIARVLSNDVVFNAAGQLLIVDANHVAHVYDTKDGALVEIERKTISLPEEFSVLGWL
jgi:hypothetical protein